MGINTLRRGLLWVRVKHRRQHLRENLSVGLPLSAGCPVLPVYRFPPASPLSEADRHAGRRGLAAGMN